jgi:uncharacterized protein (DUF486 family)
VKTFLLLLASNIFMTFAWYGQLKLKFFEGRSLGFVILVSWGIAFFEYLLMVPANRIGYANGMTGYQLKVMQEVITLGVFVGFAWLVLGERLGRAPDLELRGQLPADPRRGVLCRRRQTRGPLSLG